MEHDGVEVPGDLEVHVWDPGSGYRTCPECGGDCVPEPSSSEGHGIRIMFVCPGTAHTASLTRSSINSDGRRPVKRHACLELTPDVGD